MSEAFDSRKVIGVSLSVVILILYFEIKLVRESQHRLGKQLQSIVDYKDDLKEVQGIPCPSRGWNAVSSDGGKLK
jgi:hypothetical protein